MKPFSRAFAASPWPGRQAEPELAADRLAEAPTGEVRPHRLARGRLPQVALVEGSRLLQHRVQPVSATARLLDVRRQLLVFERDPETLRKPLDGLGEIELLELADEADRVAALAAAEAVEQLVDRVHREARRPLVVERATAGEARARPLERGVLRDEIDHVRRRAHLCDRGVLDPRHQDDSEYSSANRSVMPAR